MSWHINFRHYGDATFFGVCNQFTNLIVSIEFSAVTTWTLILRVIELRINLTFYTPCGIIGKMPMEIIDFI